jgi:hypothetical protein
VTLLAPLLLLDELELDEPDPELDEPEPDEPEPEPDVLEEPDDEVGVDAEAVVPEPELPVEPTLVVAVSVDAVVNVWRLRAKAGSWPVTSVIVISSQVATNRATAPAKTLRRIICVLWVLVMDSSLARPRRNTVRAA